MAIWFVLISEAVKGQQPDEDNPFVPYLEYADISPEATRYEETIQHETLGYKVIPPGSDLDYDLDIQGSVCPFTLNMKFSLAFFQAECEEVDFNEERIIVPVGCRFTMQLEGKHKARIEHKTCPTVLVFKNLKGA